MFISADIVADVKGTGEIVSSKKGVKYVNIKTVRSKIKVGGQQSKVVNTDGDRNNEIISKYRNSLFISE